MTDNVKLHSFDAKPYSACNKRYPFSFTTYHQAYKLFYELCQVAEPDVLKSYFTDYESLKDISYAVNNMGFRSNKEFILDSDEPTVWVFGDSLTFGDGVPDNSAWPEVLNSMIDETVYNFAKAGSGIETAIRLLENWLKETKNPPKKILVYGYYRSRIEIEENNSYVNAINTSITEKDYQNNVTKLIKIAGDIPIHIVDFLDSNTLWHEHYVDFAYDINDSVYAFAKDNNKLSSTFIKYTLDQPTCPHPGISSHKNIANMFFNEFFS